MIIKLEVTSEEMEEIYYALLMINEKGLAAKVEAQWLKQEKNSK